MRPKNLGSIIILVLKNICFPKKYFWVKKMLWPKKKSLAPKNVNFKKILGPKYEKMKTIPKKRQPKKWKQPKNEDDLKFKMNPKMGNGTKN